VFHATKAWQDSDPPAMSQREQPSNIESVKGSLPPTEASAAASDTASAPGGLPSQLGDSCEQQAWPYIDQQCRGAQPDRGTRAVRVVSTDRTAPSTLVTAVPPPPPGAVSRTTDGHLYGQASAVLPGSVHVPPATATPGRDQPRSRGSASRRDTIGAALDAAIPREMVVDNDYKGHRPVQAYASPSDSRVSVHRKTGTSQTDQRGGRKGGQARKHIIRSPVLV
jgi:hypothetical protein